MPAFPFSPVPMGSPPAISIAESLGLGSSDVDMKQVVLKAPIEKVIDPIQQKTYMGIQYIPQGFLGGAFN